MDLTEFSHHTWTIFSTFKFPQDHFYYVIDLNKSWVWNQLLLEMVDKQFMSSKPISVIKTPHVITVITQI